MKSADALIKEALQGREVTAHVCPRCLGATWFLTIAGDCICAGCGQVPATIKVAAVPVVTVKQLS